MPTQEYAKKPEAKVKIKCGTCRREYPVAEMLHEEPMPPPNETTVEGFILCPSCGDRQHSYYMTETLLFRQRKLAELLENWNLTHDPKVWSKYRIAQQQYQTNFDNTQVRVAALVAREASSAEKS